jgi:RimJ/RimL family protein N-acetyltransferase
VISPFSLRRAQVHDIFQILELYLSIYNGSYTNPMMTQPALLRDALLDENIFWMVAETTDDGARVVGSVVYQVDRKNTLAKVFGAVVEPGFRGHHMTEAMMQSGYELLRQVIPPIEVVYATTRTVSSAPQKLTASLGYQKLGIFPNVHKTHGYETHCLTALFSEEAIKNRHSDFLIHPKVAPIYEIARRECSLPPLAVDQRYISSPNSWSPKVAFELEKIDAPLFVKRRFQEERSATPSEEHHWFYPFLDPNILITSADQKIEVFCAYERGDCHCVVIGLRDKANAGFYNVLSRASEMMHESGARYLEFIMRADEVEKIDMAIQAGFIPCGYFPAMHLFGGVRYDFVVFSRSYEVLNFRKLQLEGVNQEYLAQYIHSWQELSLIPDTNLNKVRTKDE